MKNILLSVVFFGLLLVACDKNRIFDDYKTIEDNSWNVSHPVSFEVAIQDSSVFYNIFLKVRNNQDYENKNLWLFIKCTDPYGLVEINTRMDCLLADDEGRWLGKGLGDIFDSSYVLNENFRFKHAGIYKFEIMHGMRENIITGVRDIGLRVEKRIVK